MKSDRRNPKLAGIIRKLVIKRCKYKGSGKEELKPGASQMDHIRREAENRYTQVLNTSGYAAPKLDKVRVGFIGLGGRGSAAVTRLSYLEGVEIKGLCDVIPEKAEAAKSRIKTSGHTPVVFSGSEDSWMELCRRDDIDLVYVATPWPLHAPMGIYARIRGNISAGSAGSYNS